MRRHTASNSVDTITKARGTFVVVAESRIQTLIMTSHNGVLPYYYFFDGTRLFHGNTVSAVCVKASLAWKWNYTALGDYLSMNHTMNDATLHPLIKRTNPGEVVSAEWGKLYIRTSYDQYDKRSATCPNDLIEELSEEVLTWWKSPLSILSISGGLDSRLLLAILMASNIRPPLLVCGQESAFDLQVAIKISTRFDLELTHTVVNIDDFIDACLTIPNQTNGLLPISHWPGVLFAKGVDNKLVFVGFNGESARSYYDDSGLLSFLRFGLNSTGSYGSKFWMRKFYKAFTQEEISEVDPRLAEEFSPRAYTSRIARLMGSEPQLGRALERAFVNEYCRHKTGADVAALSLSVPWVAPFSSPRWTLLAKNLPYHWKLGSRFHRYAIGKLAPELLSLPEECNHLGMTTFPNPSLKYWLNLEDKGKAPPFFDQKLYEDPALLDFINQSLTYLDDLVPVKLLRKIGASPQRRRVFFQLGALALWRKQHDAQHVRI